MHKKIDTDVKISVYESILALEGKMTRFWGFLRMKRLDLINDSERDQAAALIEECCKKVEINTQDITEHLGALYVIYLSYSEKIKLNKKSIDDKTIEKVTHLHQEVCQELEKCKKHYKPGFFETIFKKKADPHLVPGFQS